MSQHFSPQGRTAIVAVVRPGCGEASATVVHLGRTTTTVKGTSVDPDRSAKEAGARAARIVRRLATEHHLVRLVTLTYGGARQQDRDRCVEDVQRFIKRLRRRITARYVWVLELHRDGLHYHVHLLVDRYIGKPLLEELWGHGFVDVRMIRGSSHQAARSAGRYAAKYVAKDAATGQGRKPGQQRYGRSEGLRIEEHRAYFGTFQSAITAIEEAVGFALEWFDCTRIDGWTGPPCYVASW